MSEMEVGLQFPYYFHWTSSILQLLTANIIFFYKCLQAWTSSHFFPNTHFPLRRPRVLYSFDLPPLGQYLFIRKIVKMMVDFLVTNPFLSRETENVVDPDVFVLPALARNFPLNVCEVSTAGDSAFSAFHFWHRTLALRVRTVLKRRVPGNNWFPAADGCRGSFMPLSWKSPSHSRPFSQCPISNRTKSCLENCQAAKYDYFM